jgi:nucleotide-binding universal stress UspA family protein
MRILLATDGSESAQNARNFVAHFPFPKESEITLLTVIDQDIFLNEEASLLKDEQRIVLKEVERAAWEMGKTLVESESIHLRDTGWKLSTAVHIGHPAMEIVRVAEDMQVDLVVAGSQGITGMKHFLLGSVSEKILNHAPCSVLIIKNSVTEKNQLDQTPRDSFFGKEKISWRVLVAFDDSGPAQKAVTLCASLPFDASAEIVGLTILPLVNIYRQDMQLHLKKIIRQKKTTEETALNNAIKNEQWTTPNVSTQLSEASNISQDILETARELKSNLIFIGHKGKSAVEKFFLGSVTNWVAKHAKCAVWVVRN